MAEKRLSIYEIHQENITQSFYIKTNASKEAINEAIEFVRKSPDYDFNKFLSALRLMGYKAQVINVDADDLFVL